MGFVHGSSIRALVNEKEISSEISGVRYSFTRTMSEVTTGGQTAGQAGAAFTPGLMAGALALRGPQQADPTTGLTKEIQDAIGTDNAFLCTALTDTDAVGKPAMFVLGDITDYAIDAAVADAVGMTLAAQADESVEMGFVLQPLGSQSGTTTNIDPGTFEAGVTGWTPTGGTFAQSAAQAHSGSNSGLLTVSGSPSQAYVRPTNANKVPVTVGGWYQSTAWIRSSAGLSDIAMSIDWLDSGGNYLSTSARSGISISANTWTQVDTGGFVAPASAAYAVYGPTLQNNPANGTVLYLDDITFGPSNIGTAVDRGASPITPTSAGLVAAIHILAVTGTVTITVKIQHSTDNSTWADLAAFTAFSAIGSERIKVAKGTTVNRYLRAVADVTGTGSATYLVAAAPR